MEDVPLHADGEGEEIGSLSPARSDCWEIVASDPASPLPQSNYGRRRGEHEVEDEVLEEEHGEGFRLVGGGEDQEDEEEDSNAGSKKHRHSAFDEYFAYGVLPLSASGTVVKEELEPEGLSVTSGSQEMAERVSTSSQIGTMPHAEESKNSSGASASGTVEGSFSYAYDVPNVSELGDEGMGLYAGSNRRDAESVISEQEYRDGGSQFDSGGGDVGDEIEAGEHFPSLHQSDEIEAGEHFPSLHQSEVNGEQSSNSSRHGDPVVMHDDDPSASASRTSNSSEELLSSHGARISRPKGYASVTMAWLQTHLGQWWAYIHRTKTLYSAALVAAVVGLLILGRGWQRVHSQNQQLQSQVLAKDKKISQLMFQLIHMKEVIAKARQIPVIWTKTSLQNP